MVLTAPEERDLLSSEKHQSSARYLYLGTILVRSRRLRPLASPHHHTAVAAVERYLSGLLVDAFSFHLNQRKTGRSVTYPRDCQRHIYLHQSSKFFVAPNPAVWIYAL